MSQKKGGNVFFQAKNPYNPYNLKKIRTIRTIRTILGLKKIKSVQSVQSVHFGHPAYINLQVIGHEDSISWVKKSLKYAISSSFNGVKHVKMYFLTKSARARTFAPIFLKLHFAVTIHISEFACKKSASYDNAKLCLNTV